MHNIDVIAYDNCVAERPRAEGGVRPRIAIITPSHVRQIGCPITATPTPIIFWVKENHGRQEAQRAAGQMVVGEDKGMERKDQGGHRIKGRKNKGMETRKMISYEGKSYI